MSHVNSYARITAIGTYVPEKVLTNSDLEQMVDTTHEWIVQRTGMIERRIAGENEFTSHLCINAVRNMVERYNVSLRDVDYIIVGTTTPDTIFPSMSALVQAEFGIDGCGAIDISAACAAFVSGLQLANGLIASGIHRKILVIGAETLSKVTDYTDRSTCILFGDGAGAVLVERVTGEPGAFLAAYNTTAGKGGIHVYRANLAQQLNGTPLSGGGKMVQNGREVYRWAVSTVPEGMNALIKQTEYSLQDVDWFVPHSANLRMIESICEKSGFPFERTLHSLQYYGNTSAATIPLAIDLALRDGRVKPGDLMLLFGFGGGLVQAGLLLRWTAEAQ
ncbi:ketoacyl-ACP synthase III [Paenibacillus sp. CECT 9249]|uniref:ketoacyl-ACP synthase III n=1 Tax=unclassified Paenibacillus TaxID=185978 RepID=UPI001C1036F3|nr:ketoacyl-ACP synthase III [Paenibacillus sp. CECT 9249]MBU5440792.1 ketoacyl-ACP synthase III [Paenibacillus sp. MSJ-34]